MKTKTNAETVENKAEAAMETFTSTAPAPLEPMDLTKFQLSEDFFEGAATKALVNVPVRKPSREAFVRTSSDPSTWQLAGLIEMKEQNRIYFVLPELAATLRDEGESTFTLAKLVLTVDKRGTPFLWPLKVSNRDSDWNDSAARGAEMAKDQWVRVTANMQAQAYDVAVAANQETVPAWPKESYADILRIAFQNRIIDSREHPVLKELNGE